MTPAQRTAKRKLRVARRSEAQARRDRRKQSRPRLNSGSRATPAAVAESKALLESLSQRVGEFRRLIADSGIEDGALLVTMPDAQDRQALAAECERLATTGASVDDRFVQDVLRDEITVLPYPRAELLALVEGEADQWHEASLEYLRHPPLGSIPAVVNGTACGHFVAVLGCRFTPGGSS